MSNVAKCPSQRVRLHFGMPSKEKSIIKIFNDFQIKISILWLNIMLYMHISVKLVRYHKCCLWLKWKLKHKSIIEEGLSWVKTPEKKPWLPCKSKRTLKKKYCRNVLPTSPFLISFSKEEFFYGMALKNDWRSLVLSVVKVSLHLELPSNFAKRLLFARIF